MAGYQIDKEEFSSRVHLCHGNALNTLFPFLHIEKKQFSYLEFILSSVNVLNTVGRQRIS